jgi:hypothetical protein
MSVDTRLWMYKAGEARLFDHPGEVPAGDGWQRFPISQLEEDGQRGPSGSPAAPEPGQVRGGEGKLAGMSRQRLMQVAAAHGIRIDFRWTKAQLKQAIVEVLNDNGP